MIYLSQAYETLNKLLVRVFNDILTTEERMLINDEYKDISITDMHVIEAIGYDGARNMSSIAKDLNITVGTLTIAMNSLVKKGYVKRTRSSKDRRVVLISLTEKGKQAFIHHENFHKKMIEEVVNILEDEQMDVLVLALNKIDKYFNKNSR